MTQNLDGNDHVDVCTPSSPPIIISHLCFVCVCLLLFWDQFVCVFCIDQSGFDSKEEDPKESDETIKVHEFEDFDNFNLDLLMICYEGYKYGVSGVSEINLFLKP